jgi:hypothetical protein
MALPGFISSKKRNSRLRFLGLSSIDAEFFFLTFQSPAVALTAHGSKQRSIRRAMLRLGLFIWTLRNDMEDR